MAVAQVVDTRINPSNPAQRVVLWGNGRIDVTGGPAITDGPKFYDRLDQPVVRAIWISNWTTMAGYVLDKAGGFWPFGGAPSVGESVSGFGHEVVVGIPYNPFGSLDWYRDWSWDPNTPGRGVVLDAYGGLHRFGGAPTPARTGPRWTSPVARKLVMRWTPDVRAYTLDHSGGIHADYAAVPAGSGSMYWPYADMAVDLVITNWSDGSGYLLDRNAGVWKFGSAIGVHSRNYKLGADRARALEVLNPADPLRLWEVWAGGQEIEWAASSPPTVVAGGSDSVSPASTVTGTTRPVLAWSYSDPQSDSQAEVRVLVFTETFVGSHSMTDPAVHAASAVVDVTSRDPMLRGIASPVDLENAAYRMYVRAQDSAGQWSPWSNRGWTQAVPLPTTPTGLTATANEDALAVDLSVSADAAVADLVRFEWSDDGVTWAAVDGADAVPIAATTLAVDRFPPLGKPRTYRATAYSLDPRTASTPSAAASATVARRTYTLHAREDAAIGGHLNVQEPVSWTRTVAAGVFQGIGDEYPTVVSDGGPKSRRSTLHVLTLDADAWQRVAALVEANATLVYRDPFGSVRYCRVVGEWSQDLLSGSALNHRHTSDLPLIEVRPPHLPA